MCVYVYIYYGICHRRISNLENLQKSQDVFPFEYEGSKVSFLNFIKNNWIAYNTTSTTLNKIFSRVLLAK